MNVKIKNKNKMRNFDCIICNDNIIIKSDAELICDKCNVCNNCQIEWYLSNLKSNHLSKEIKVKCSDYRNCSLFIDMDKLEKILNKTNRINEYNQILFDRYLIFTQDIIKCPTNECNYSGFYTDKTCNKPFKCDTCTVEFTIFEINDHLMYYSKFSLSKWINEKLRLYFDFDLSNFAILLTTTKCPNCKTPISKTEGCDHMTCQICRTEFCYYCEMEMRREDLQSEENFEISTAHNKIHNDKVSDYYRFIYPILLICFILRLNHSFNLFYGISIGIYYFIYFTYFALYFGLSWIICGLRYIFFYLQEVIIVVVVNLILKKILNKEIESNNYYGKSFKIIVSILIIVFAYNLMYSNVSLFDIIFFLVSKLVNISYSFVITLLKLLYAFISLLLHFLAYSLLCYKYNYSILNYKAIFTYSLLLFIYYYII